jgi:hypothetical protein
MPVTSQTPATNTTTTFTKVQTSDRLINQVQANIANAVNPLLELGNFNVSFAKIFLGGNLLTKVSLVTGSNTIVHNLGYAPTGWLITRLRSSATIYDTQDTNANAAKTLKLTASANCVADIYVF